ncbi:MAG: hypothetical protein LKK00_09045 [Intestinimonas sp.]|jgi:hypothetical protein|nr:hypothetical protein [Intestinimonas sp.]
MKRQKRRIVPIVLLILAVIAAGVVFWQRENLEAIRLLAGKSSGELADEIEAQQQQTQKAMESYGDLGVRDLTPEEESELIQGTLTVEEAVGRITNSTDAPAQAQSDTESADTPTQTQQPDAEGEQRAGAEETREVVSRYVAQMYTIKAQFLGKLNQLYEAAKSDYLALPAAERTDSKKRSIAMHYAVEASAMESDCDDQVNAVLESLTAELKQCGADISIVDTIRQSYEDQKALKKAYYMSLLS